MTPNIARITCYLLILLIFYAKELVAVEKINSVNEAHIKFSDLVVSVNEGLMKRQAEFKTNPTKLVQFIDENLLRHWAAEITLKKLVGTTIWKSTSLKEKSRLERAFNNTIQRYVQEGFSHYDGQEVRFVSIKINDKGNKGYLTVEVIPNLLPRFDVVLKIGQINQDWLLYDVLIEGVSYTALKKDGFQKAVKEGGVNLLVKNLSDKNQGFIPSSIGS